MIDDILKERNGRYGDFLTEAHRVMRIRAALKGDNAHPMTHVQNHALYMIATKLARIANGDPNYKDNWLDIIGYCKLVLADIDRERE